MKKIMFTGGGTAGHIVPNIALINELNNYEIHYIGTNGMESKLIPTLSNVKFHTIKASKLVRSFKFSTILLPFKLISSIIQAKKIIKEVKPDIIFSKGGYVGLPVTIAGKRCKVKVIIHESDITEGLSNRLASKFADKILTTYNITTKIIGEKAVCIGSPIRQSLYKGNKQKGLQQMGFSGKRPILLVMGGSQGAASINNAVYANITELNKKFDVFVISGKGKQLNIEKSSHFNQTEYINDLSDIFAAISMCLTRSGSNSLCELVSLKIPTLTVPLAKATRGEQKLNADYFNSEGCVLIANDDELESQLLAKIDNLYTNRFMQIECQKNIHIDGTQKIVEIIKNCIE